MKMILALADQARRDALLDVIRRAGAPGYTELPVIEGAGRTGLHAGDRIHPGGLIVILIVVEDSDTERLLATLAEHRDASGDVVTRFFVLPVERQA